ncbi:MAG: ABC transporter permease [Cyclobacteriaceae bacterium]
MKDCKPPKLFVKLLVWFCPEELKESIQGDLEEAFFDDLEQKGIRRAKTRFAWNVIRFCRPGILSRNNKQYHFSQQAMFKNYFKIAYRNLLRYKFFSLINLLGLSIGLSMSLFIITHIKGELSYEKDFPKHELIYRLASKEWAREPPLLATEFKKLTPEVKAITRFFDFHPSVIEHNKNQILVERPFMADPATIEIFDLSFVKGKSEGALSSPLSVVLTENMTRRLFKDGINPIGEVITINGRYKYTVTGVIENLPENTHLKFDCLMSTVDSFIEKNDSRGWAGVSIYALFDSYKDVKKVERKMTDFQLQFYDGLYSREEILEEIEKDGLVLDPITDIHLRSDKEKELEANSNIAFVYIFLSLASFILLVVIINFVNLYVAQTLNRLKEIGLRKVMGAQRMQLIIQFMSEAFFLVLLSGVIAIALVYFTIPFYNDLAGTSLSLVDLFSGEMLMMLASLLLFVGVLAGFYPAIYLSRFGIDEGLRTKILKINHRLPMRTAMVAFQFLIAICLLTATLIVSQQMDFIQTKKLGYAAEEIVAIKLHGELYNQAVNHSEKVRNELVKNADIQYTTLVSAMVGDRFGIEPFELKSNREHPATPRHLAADAWFPETMGLDILKGQLVSKTFDGVKYLINEKLASQFNAENLIGQQAENSFRKNEGTIAGVISDFHFASLHNQIDPLAIEIKQVNRNADYLLVRISTSNIKATMQTIEQTLSELAPGSMIISQFLNDKTDQLYRSENNLFKVFKIFSISIICLACLGLFALFAFISQARTKELGIRKVLGASLGQLLILMSKSYLGVLAITGLLALPITMYFSSSWLANFAFQAPIYWWSYVIPTLIIIALAVFAIVLQSLRVARKNPTDSLQSE